MLIWIGCFFVATILNTLLGYATGIKAGYLVFYFVVYFVAKKLCNKWDEQKEAKEMSKKATTSINIPVVEETSDTNDIRFCRKCGERLIDNSQFCRKCGAKMDDDIVIESHVARNLNESICETHKEANTTKKSQGSSVSIVSVVSIILSALSILSIIIAMNVQDADRNIYEPLNPTVLYFVLIGVNIVYPVVLLFLKDHSISKCFMAFVPALFSITALLEGSLFSNGQGYYNSYINSDLVNIFNAIWVSLSFVILLMNLIPLSLALRSKWHHTVKYREKCYMRVAKMNEYLNNGIISQEEFEKNKKEILKNIEM